MTFACAPPSVFDMRLLAAVVVLLLLPVSAFAEGRVWLSGGGGVGAGSQRFDSMSVVAKVDGYLWPRTDIGVVASMLMSPSAEGSVVAAGVAYRVDLEKVDTRSGVPNHMHVAALVGRDQEYGLAWMARIGMHRRYGAMLLSLDLVGYGSAGVAASWLTSVGVGVVL